MVTMKCNTCNGEVAVAEGVDSFVCAHCGAEQTVTKVVATDNTQTSVLLKRVSLFLEEGNWKSAAEYCEKVLDIDPECAEAHLGKLMAELKVHTRENLKTCKQSFADSISCKNAMRFGDEAMKAELQEAIDLIENNKKQKKKKTTKLILFAVILVFLAALGYFVIYPWISVMNGNYKVYINMYKVEEFTIPDEVTEIKDEQFSNCQSLKNVNIPDSVTSIGYRAFYGCNDLRSINIPDSVTSIGEEAFFDCTYLTSVTIGDGVTSISNSAFQHCTALNDVNFGDNVTTIEGDAFYDCSELSNVTLPDGLTSIGGWAFAKCDRLGSITIPSSVTHIGEFAFDISGDDYKEIDVYITDLVAWCNIHFESSPLYPNGDLYLNNELVTYLDIPEDITTIPDDAFMGCDSIREVTIPDSVTTIGDCAFFDCDSLTSISIPDSVTTIGNSAFYDCDSLTSISIPNSVTDIGTLAFDNSNKLNTIYFDGTKGEWYRLNVVISANSWEIEHEEDLFFFVKCSDATLICERQVF